MANSACIATQPLGRRLKRFIDRDSGRPVWLGSRSSTGTLSGNLARRIVFFDRGIARPVDAHEPFSTHLIIPGEGIDRSPRAQVQLC